MCREMLFESPGIEQDELLADVVGYLEACRDRLVDVIEAGTNGILGEDLFAQCLKVNDAVTRTLDAERVRKESRSSYTPFLSFALISSRCRRALRSRWMTTARRR